MAELSDSKYAEYWTKGMKSELECHAAIGTFSDENILQRVNIISAKWDFVSKTNSNGVVTEAKARLVARGFAQQPGVENV